MSSADGRYGRKVDCGSGYEQDWLNGKVDAEAI